MKTRSAIIYSLTLVFVVYLLYGQLGKIFFEQDEWMALGNALILGPKFIFAHIGSPFWAILGRGRILSAGIFYFFLTRFGLNTVPLGYFGLALHAINTLLVFQLIRKLFKNNFAAFLGALFFSVNAASTGAITWLASVVGTLPATTLILLALIFSNRFSAVSLLLLYFSLQFKEIGIYLFLLIRKKYFLPLLVAFFAVTIPWIFFFKGVSDSQDLFLTGASGRFWSTLVARLILYPATSFSLTFVPPASFLGFAKVLTSIYYSSLPSPIFNLVAQTAVLDMLGFALSLLLIFALYFFAKKDTKRKKDVLFLGLGLAGSFLPYILIDKSFAYLESRYYYLGAVFAGAILSYFFLRISEKYPNKWFKAFLCVCTLLFVFWHFQMAREELGNKLFLSQERRNLINQILSIKREPDKKNVFYLTGDRNYYISEGNPIPLQQGTGYTLLILYYNTGKIPPELVKERFLWNLGSQGYKEVDGQGFGFFWDQKELDKFEKEGKFNKDNVISLYYDSKNKLLQTK